MTYEGVWILTLTGSWTSISCCFSRLIMEYRMSRRLLEDGRPVSLITEYSSTLKTKNKQDIIWTRRLSPQYYSREGGAKRGKRLFSPAVSGPVFTVSRLQGLFDNCLLGFFSSVLKMMTSHLFVVIVSARVDDVFEERRLLFGHRSWRDFHGHFLQKRGRQYHYSQTLVR